MDARDLDRYYANLRRERQKERRAKEVKAARGSKVKQAKAHTLNKETKGHEPKF